MIFKENNIVFKKFNKNIIFFLFLFELIYILCFMNIGYETDDDSAMNLLSSGMYSGKPTEYLIFTNVFIGYCLKFLYCLNLNINWYVWYLLFSLSLGYFTIQYLIDRFFINNLFARIAVHLSIFYFFSTLFSELQFTRVAVILILTGIILLMIYDNKKKIILGTLLLILGSLIRIDILYINGIILLPFFIYLFYIKKYKRLIMVCFMFFICFLFSVMNDLVYSRNLELVEYKKFNRLQYQITKDDNPSFKYENVKNILDKIGWTFEDYDVATNFNFDYGIDKFSQKNLILITNSLRENKKQPTLGQLWLYLNQTISIVKDYLLSKSFFILLIFPFYFLIKNGDFKKILCFLSFSFYIIALLTIVKIFNLGNLEKERIIFSFTVPAIFLLCLLNIIKLRDNGFFSIFTRNKTNILVSFLAILTNIILFNSNKSETIFKSNEIYKIIKKQKDPFYISWCGYQSDNIFEMPNDYTNAYFLGWYVGSPANRLKVTKYMKINCNGVYSIINKEIIYYFYNRSYFYRKMRYHQKIVSFYKKNFKDVRTDIKNFPISNSDTLFRYSFIISSK
jgi:hypothetical protein